MEGSNEVTFTIVSSDISGVIGIEKYIYGDKKFGSDFMLFIELGRWRAGSIIPKLNEELIYTPFK